LLFHQLAFGWQTVLMTDNYLFLTCLFNSLSGILRLVMSSVIRAAGLLVYREVNGISEYLLLQASYPPHHYTPPKGLFLLHVS
jgi:hypothetical protein